MGPKELHLVETSRGPRTDKASHAHGTKAGPKATAPRRRRLTASSLTRLRSEAEPVDLTDPDCPGLQLHVAARLADGSEGARSWQYRFRWRGKRVRATLGQHPQTGIAAAHELVREARELLGKGIDPRKSGIVGRSRAPRAEPSSGGTAPYSIDALASEFMARFITPNRKNPAEVQRMLDKDVLSEWAGRDARTIKPRDVLELLDGIVDRGSAIMSNRVHSLLKQLFKYGVHRQIIEVSPVQLLYLPGGQEKPRSRSLNDLELAALLANIDDVMSRAPRTVATIRLMLYTACRRGEIGLARWSHFHLDGGAPTWRVPPELSKTGVEYVVPLVPEAVEELRKLKRTAGRSPWVFPNGAADKPADPKILTRSLARHLEALAAKKIKPFVLHDIRRTVRTGLAILKVAPHIAERCLNHAQPGIVATYDVYAYADEKRAALGQWAAHLEGLK
jgi:integrase